MYTRQAPDGTGRGRPFTIPDSPDMPPAAEDWSRPCRSSNHSVWVIMRRGSILPKTNLTNVCNDIMRRQSSFSIMDPTFDLL